MNPLALDALLIDRALVELAPETVELLDAYLAQNPTAAARAAELAATVGQARRVVSLAPLQLPAPEFLHRHVAARRWWPAAKSAWMPLAACLALGALLGWAGGASRKALIAGSAPPVREPVPARVAPPPGSVAPWRVADVHSRRGTTEPSPRYRLVWKSPIHLSHLEEKP